MPVQRDVPAPPPPAAPAATLPVEDSVTPVDVDRDDPASVRDVEIDEPPVFMRPLVSDAAAGPVPASEDGFDAADADAPSTVFAQRDDSRSDHVMPVAADLGSDPAITCFEPTAAAVVSDSPSEAMPASVVQPLDANASPMIERPTLEADAIAPAQAEEAGFADPRPHVLDQPLVERMTMVDERSTAPTEIVSSSTAEAGPSVVSADQPLVAPTLGVQAERETTGPDDLSGDPGVLATSPPLQLAAQLWEVAGSSGREMLPSTATMPTLGTGDRGAAPGLASVQLETVGVTHSAPTLGMQPVGTATPTSVPGVVQRFGSTPDASRSNAPARGAAFFGGGVSSAAADVAAPPAGKSATQWSADPPAAQFDRPSATTEPLPMAVVTASRSAGDIAVSSGLARRNPDGAVVFRTLDAPSAAQSAPTTPTTPTTPSFSSQVGVADDGGGGDDGDGFSVQLESAAASANPSSTGAAAGGGGAAGGDLDELARKLYGRIRLHLRKELLLDRERSGSLVETRR